MCSQGSEWFHGNSVKIIVEIVRHIHFFLKFINTKRIHKKTLDWALENYINGFSEDRSYKGPVRLEFEIFYMY